GTFIPSWQTVSDPYDFARAVGDAAQQRGAQMTVGEVLEVQPQLDGVVLRLRDGRTLSAAKAVVACGAWSKALTAALGDPVPLDTERGYNTTLPPGSFDLRLQITLPGHGFVISPLSSG